MVLWDLIKPHKHTERKPEALLFPTDLTLIDDFRKTQRRAPLTKCCEKKKQWYLDSPSEERKNEEEEEEEEEEGGWIIWASRLSYRLQEQQSNQWGTCSFGCPRGKGKNKVGAFCCFFFYVSCCSSSAELRLSKTKAGFYFQVRPIIICFIVLKGVASGESWPLLYITLGL